MLGYSPGFCTGVRKLSFFGRMRPVLAKSKNIYEHNLHIYLRYIPYITLITLQNIEYTTVRGKHLVSDYLTCVPALKSNCNYVTINIITLFTLAMNIIIFLYYIRCQILVRTKNQFSNH